MVNSSVNCWFVEISLLIADLSVPVKTPPEEFLPKNLKIIETSQIIEASLVWYYEFLAILNVFSRNTLSEALLLGKYLKSS